MLQNLNFYRCTRTKSFIRNKINRSFIEIQFYDVKLKRGILVFKYCDLHPNIVVSQYLHDLEIGI